MPGERHPPAGAAWDVSSDREALARRDLLQKTLRGFREKRDLDDGLAFAYPDNRRWARRLAEFKQSWVRSHPLVGTELVREPDRGLIWLRMRVPDELRLSLEHQIRRSRDGQSLRSRRLRHASRLLPRLLSSPFRVMPDFVVIGAARAGTSSLYYWLVAHPNVVAAFRKEVYFFDRTYRRGSAWYRAFFPTASQMRVSGREEEGRLITGEATPDYMFHPHAARRMAQVLPDAKLIVVLRDPVARAHSFYHLQLRRAIETLPFSEAINREEERLDGELEKMQVDENYFSFARQNYSYLARSVYADQLEWWREHFAPEQILILSSEEIDRDPTAVSTRLTKHLGLRNGGLPERDRLNASRYPGLDEGVRERLRDYFRPHNERLYEMLGRDFGWDR